MGKNVEMDPFMLAVVVLGHWQFKYKDTAQLSMIACFYCSKSHPEIETPFEHASDCIVKRYEGK